MNESGCEVEQGAVGELCVKGPGLMECYYKDPAATAEALQDGWLHTGDMARQDEDGFYWLVDRKKDVIITGGENLYPVQIEDFMSRDLDIQDVAVIGLSDERLGEIACAVMELKPGSHATEDDINKFCRFRTTGSRAGSSSQMCRAMRQARSRSRSFDTATARRGLWTTRTSLRGKTGKGYMAKQLLSDNEAAAQSLWEAGVAVGARYPRTPSTEMPENLVKKDGPPASGHRTRRWRLRSRSAPHGRRALLRRDEAYGLERRCRSFHVRCEHGCEWRPRALYGRRSFVLQLAERAGSEKLRRLRTRAMPRPFRLRGDV